MHKTFLMLDFIFEKVCPDDRGSASLTPREKKVSTVTDCGQNNANPGVSGLGNLLAIAKMTKRLYCERESQHDPGHPG